MLLTSYDPTGAARIVADAMARGQASQQASQALLMSQAREFAQERRLQRATEQKLEYERLKDAEERRRWDIENAPLPLGAPPSSPAGQAGSILNAPQEGVTPTSIPEEPKPANVEGVDLWTAGGLAPRSRSLLTGEPMATKEAKDIAGEIFRTTADIGAGVPNLPPETIGGLSKLEEAASTRYGLAKRAEAETWGGRFGLEEVPTVDPFKVGPDQFAGAVPTFDVTGGPGIPGPAIGAQPSVADLKTGAASALPVRGGLPTEAEIAGAAASVSGADNSFAGRVAADLQGFQRAGIPVTRKNLSTLLPSIMSAESRVGRYGAGGTGEDIDEVVRQKGMSFVAEHGTYRKPDGSEWIMGRTATGRVNMKQYQPNSKAADVLIGSDGQPYAIDAKGDFMKPVPEGVSFSKRQLQHVTGKGTFIIDMGTGKETLIIPEQVKLPQALQTKWMSATAEVLKAKESLEGAQKLAAEKKDKGMWSYFGAGPDAVKSAERRLSDARSKVKAFRLNNPGLPDPEAEEEAPTAPTSAPQAAPAPTTPPAAAPPAQVTWESMPVADRAASITAAKAKLKANPSLRPTILQRLKDAGLSEADALKALGL